MRKMKADSLAELVGMAVTLGLPVGEGYNGPTLLFVKLGQALATVAMPA